MTCDIIINYDYNYFYGARLNSNQESIKSVESPQNQGLKQLIEHFYYREMGAEGSRYEYNHDEEDDIFGPGYLQSPPNAKPGVPQATTSTLVDIHNGIIIGSQISAIRKLRVSDNRITVDTAS